MAKLVNLWTVGASTRALANSCVQGGYAIQAADQFCDLDLQRLGPTQRLQNYPQDLLTLANNLHADAWLYTGGLENEPELVDALASCLPLLGNDGAVLRAVRDVNKLQTVLQATGFHMPEMRVKFAKQDPRDWLIKSTNSSGGLRVRQADEMPLQSHEYYQQFIPGKVFGVVFIGSEENTHLLGVSRHLEITHPHVRRFQYAGSIGPVIFTHDRCMELERLGACLTTAFQLRGWFGVDFVLDDHARVWILEVNPRYTASVEVLERAAEVSSAELHLQACTHAPLDSTLFAAFQTKSNLVGKVIHYAERIITISESQSQAWLARAMHDHDLADIPAAGTVINPGEPILTQFATGNSEQEVVQSLAFSGRQIILG